MKRKQSSGLFVLILILIFAALCGAYKFLNNSSSGKSSPKGQVFVFNKKAGNYIAALYIEGVIQEENLNYNQKWLLDTIQTLKNDKKNNFY